MASEHLQLRAERNPRDAWLWATTAIMAALTHLPADMVVSGSAIYSDWEVKALWPFSDRGWVWPCVPWGDVGITVLFILGSATMIARPQHTRIFAALTLAAVLSYIVMRPLVAGE